MGIILLFSLILATASLTAPVAGAQDEGDARQEGEALSLEQDAPPGNWRESLEEHIRTEGEAKANRGTVTIVLYLRFLPNLDATVLAVMPAGSTVEIIGAAENGFVPVTFDGVSGYASETFVRTEAAPVAASTDEPAAAVTADAAPVAAAGTDIVSIIYAAAAAYGQSGDDMLRVATCESGLNPYAYNPAGWYGLFQFVPSTFASTPYGAYDINDPVANANAAAWMWSVGRRGEWSCQ